MWVGCFLSLDISGLGVRPPEVIFLSFHTSILDGYCGGWAVISGSQKPVFLEEQTPETVTICLTLFVPWGSVEEFCYSI